jgi:hypothetical protein
VERNVLNRQIYIKKTCLLLEEGRPLPREMRSILSVLLGEARSLGAGSLERPWKRLRDRWGVSASRDTAGVTELSSTNNAG